MGHQIIKQPNGKLAVFDSGSDLIVVWDATNDEVIDYFAEVAAEQARQSARRTVEMVAAGEARVAYRQFVMSWDEALRRDMENGGEASAPES